jgi:hypothetical protein
MFPMFDPKTTSKPDMHIKKKYFFLYMLFLEEHIGRGSRRCMQIKDRRFDAQAKR